MAEISNIIGSVGVFLLLAAFFLNLFKILSNETKTYTVLNIVGGGLACYSAILIGFIPFIILEGIWAAVSVVGLAMLLKKQASQT